MRGKATTNWLKNVHCNEEKGNHGGHGGMFVQSLNCCTGASELIRNCKEEGTAVCFANYLTGIVEEKRKLCVTLLLCVFVRKKLLIAKKTF
jgi:hypothetical protein